MKPRRTPDSNAVFELRGGNEDNSLWVERVEDTGGAVILSEWDLTPVEREAILLGGRVELCVWGRGHPPVSMAVVFRAGERSYVDPIADRQGYVALSPVMAQRLLSWLRTSAELLKERRDDKIEDIALDEDGGGAGIGELSQLEGALRETQELVDVLEKAL